MIQKLGKDNFETDPVGATEKRCDQINTANWVELVDGQKLDLERLSLDELYMLQWEQETAFASRIKASTKGTVERKESIRVAYQTVCQILSTIATHEGESELKMGMDQRYTRFVVDRLKHLRAGGVEGGLFEIGFGAGGLLESAANEGFSVGGLEVAPQLWQQAKDRLPDCSQENLCLGDFTHNEKVGSLTGRFSLVYWNDVFEHIPTDEIDDYLKTIYSLLVPGGQLVTITPNWHMRPMDVTADHKPPRTTAIGFHLKEYSLTEVAELLTKAGFEKVETPVFIGKKRIWCNRVLSGTRLKKWVEPLLEWLPYRFAVQICRRFGFTMTIAQKRSRD